MRYKLKWQKVAANETHLCAAESLSRLCVGGDSSCREESLSGTLHSLDLLHETAGTLHTGYYLYTHTHTMSKHSQTVNPKVIWLNSSVIVEYSLLSSSFGHSVIRFSPGCGLSAAVKHYNLTYKCCSSLEVITLTMTFTMQM